MAYSDYGGYAYRNGERVVDRSDFVLTEDGGFGTPGVYPGFAVAFSGKGTAEVKKAIASPTGHAVLGDGPIYVLLYKQSDVEVYLGMEQLDLVSIGCDLPQAWVHEFKGKKYFSMPFDFNGDMGPVLFKCHGHNIYVRWIFEALPEDKSPNFYQYCRLEQPDGVLWHGFSGYGVGAGLEDVFYGYSTPARVRRLNELWPGAVQQERG